jgi:hypothetical protein
VKTLIDLDPTDCRYPVAVATSNCGFGVYNFCAETCAEGKPYCTKHLALCYRPASRRQITEDQKLTRAAMRAALKNSRENESAPPARLVTDIMRDNT